MSLLHKHKTHWCDKQFLFSFFVSLCLLIPSLFIHFYAGTYATERASNSVTDLILSNTPVFDLDGIFIYGSIAFWFFIALLLFHEPKRIPFVLKSIALFVLIRSVFITLTHMGPFPDQALPPPHNLIRYVTFGGDLFFSGHTGLPFLMALIFWKNKYVRIVCLVSAVMFGVVVLLAHLHYTIDVLSAFFITYSIYSIAEYCFKKDRVLFYQGLETQQ